VIAQPVIAAEQASAHWLGFHAPILMVTAPPEGGTKNPAISGPSAVSFPA